MDTSKAVKCKRFFNEHNCEKQAVKVETLDRCLSKNEDPIGFMRIDVGGSELDVLKGSKGIIKQWFPNIQIRIERPAILEEIRRLLYGLGYRGLFFYNNEIFDLGVFDSKVHQPKKFAWSEKNPQAERPFYVEDFIFIPSSVPEE
jgi:hypothetical protein